jgi:GAF domain-containing protein
VRDLQATQQISRFVSTRRDLQDLMNEVVNLIVDLFPNIYHAQVFLLDRDKEYALLQASTGEPGRQLLERGHRLAVGSISVIGQVTENGKIELARDTGASDVHRPNEFLPETRSELAIPLYVGEEVIGALDVQSRQRNTFTEDQINILEAMAGQVAVAIRNAQLYSESLRRLEELTAFNREATLNAWRTYMRDSRQQVLVKEAGVRLDEPYDSLRDEAVAKGEPVIGEITPRDTIPFALPIVLRDQLLGAVELELPESAFTMEKVRLAQELVNRLALTLDNARLFQESQRATNRERLVNEIAAKLTNQTDLDEILQTAVREVGQALRVPVVDIEMRMSPSMQRSTPPTSNGHPTDSPVKNGKHS